MSSVKYLVTREEDQRVFAECYDEKLVQKVALALEDRYAAYFDIVSCDPDKRYEYLDGRGPVEEAESHKSEKCNNQGEKVKNE